MTYEIYRKICLFAGSGCILTGILSAVLFIRLRIPDVFRILKAGSAPRSVNRVRWKSKKSAMTDRLKPCQGEEETVCLDEVRSSLTSGLGQNLDISLSYTEEKIE